MTTTDRAAASVTTGRERQKAERSRALLRESARLFAEHGYAGVRLEDVGAAVGITGPAVYRHFASKQALLAALLQRVSETLRDGGVAVVAAGGSPDEQLARLVAFHVDFAIADADVIRVQDRDLARLDDRERDTVRRLQNAYVDVWVQVLERLHPDRTAAELRVRALACFGLMNSTTHTVRGAGGVRGVRDALTTMALAALRA